jgi:hypothetical protein
MRPVEQDRPSGSSSENRECEELKVERKTASIATTGRFRQAKGASVASFFVGSVRAGSKILTVARMAEARLRTLGPIGGFRG